MLFQKQTEKYSMNTGGLNNREAWVLVENKKQHYVPRFYLKYFSHEINRDSISMYNIRTGRFVRYTNVGSQACENYFYGETLELERELAKVEAKAATIISDIKKFRRLPRSNSEEYINLMFFIFIQIVRTKYIAEEVNESANKFFHNVFSHDERLKNVLEKFEIYNEKPSVFALSTMVTHFPILLDLDYKLIINVTQHHFITSDNPTVKYNQFLLRRKWPLGKTGLAQLGLQLFFPIGPKELLILYDSKIYFVGRNKRDIAYLTKKQDVDAINSLEYLNSLNNLYFNENITEYYIRNLVKTNEKYRNIEKSHVAELSSTKKMQNGHSSSLVIVKPAEIEKDISLSFINERKYAKDCVLGSSAAVVRNKPLLEYLDNKYPR